MTLFNRDPLACSNIDELQHWVAYLQDMLETQRILNCNLREQNGLLFHINQQEGERNDQLKEVNQLLKERIAQHESGAVHSHRLRVN